MNASFNGTLTIGNDVFVFEDENLGLISILHSPGQVGVADMATLSIIKANSDGSSLQVGFALLKEPKA
tara:strand:- start:277 stop:480 length:204 start_codon:yes stop_codon:yes gene_type:complete